MVTTATAVIQPRFEVTFPFSPFVTPFSRASSSPISTNIAERGPWRQSAPRLSGSSGLPSTWIARILYDALGEFWGPLAGVASAMQVAQTP